MPTNERGGDRAPEQAGGSLGAGAEAAAGLHAVDGPDAPTPESAQNADHREASAKGGERSGSEPLGRDREHKPSYGGEGGAPRTSSDTREPQTPE